MIPSYQKNYIDNLPEWRLKEYIQDLKEELEDVQDEPNPDPEYISSIQDRLSYAQKKLEEI